MKTHNETTREINVSTVDTSTMFAHDPEPLPIVEKFSIRTLRGKCVDTEAIVFEIKNFNQLKAFLLWKN